MRVVGAVLEGRRWPSRLRPLRESDSAWAAALILALRSEQLLSKAWTQSRHHREFFQTLRGDKEAWEAIDDAS